MTYPPKLNSCAVTLVALGSLFAITDASPVMAQRTKEVRFGSADGTELRAYLIRAVGREARSPAIIGLHGCGGPLNRKRTKLGSRHRSWGRLLANAGYHVVFPDSFGSRGVGSVCRLRPRPVKQRDRVRDVEGALSWLSNQDFVDKNNISVIGWSNGGSTALRVARRSFAGRLRHVIAFYPGCRSMLKRRVRPLAARLKIIMGAADDWTSPEPCRRIANDWKVPLVLYEGALHGFDSPRSRLRQLKGLSYTAGGKGRARVGANYDARRMAIAEVLATLLKP